jgi:two-component system response regulator AtoC
MSLQNYTIVVIEKDPLLNSTVKEILSKKYKQVFTFVDAQQALHEINSISPDVILLDIFLGHANVLDILEQIRKKGHNMPVLMMTAVSDIKIAVSAMKLGAEDFVIKPLDMEQLEVAIEKTLEKYDLRRKVDLLSERFNDEHPSEMIGESKGILKAIDMGKIIAGADTTALILGESGTGKELMARFIHENSPRSRSPFVAINCGAIPRELAENELFGYEKGAFTGATEKIKQGRFEQANHGTILLDEIAELSMELQVKLLRVLQDMKFYRLGGSKEISVDVRVVASTNKDLRKLVDEDKFREDLFYRLDVATIMLPPLRERGDDIIMIATDFINEFNKKFGKKVSGFTPEAAEIINSSGWKGNIRELRNVIERIVLLENDELITAESLGFLSAHATGTKVRGKSEQTIPDGKHFLQISKSGALMGDVLKDLIISTLRISDGDQIEAAKLLGISEAKLKHSIEQYGITVSDNNTS